MITLQVQKRDMETKAKKLRREGYIIGNLCGKEITGSILLKIDQKEAQRALQGCMKGTQLMLDVEGRIYDVLIKEISYETGSRKIQSIDFQALVKDEKVHSTAPIVLHNRDKVAEGVLEQTLKEISYKAYPSALVDKVIVDVGNMRLGDSIRVSDLEIAKDKDIELLTHLDATVATVFAAHAGAEETAEDPGAEEKKG